MNATLGPAIDPFRQTRVQEACTRFHAVRKRRHQAAAAMCGGLLACNFDRLGPRLLEDLGCCPRRTCSYWQAGGHHDQPG